MNKLGTSLAAALCALASAASFAGAPNKHPALAQAGVPAEPTIMLVGHPARGAAGRAARANHDHPAVATHRAGLAPRIDPNLYRVQPPASVTWRSGADAAR
jgi:hypothetical protein